MCARGDEDTMMADTSNDVRDVDMSTGVTKRKLDASNGVGGGVDRQHKRIAKHNSSDIEQHCERNDVSIVTDSRGAGVVDADARGSG